MTPRQQPKDRLQSLPDPPEAPADAKAAEAALAAPAAPAPQEEGHRTPVVLALELGWRLAVLYADLEHPLYEVADVQVVPACLPALETMPNGDQLELQVRAAASLAFQLKATAPGNEILGLAHDVHATCHSRTKASAVRERLSACHNSLIKELWATQEAQGKAYELGMSIFDSWNRVRLAGRPGSKCPVDEWRTVFGRQRTERVKVLLDDLQSQLPRTAVTVVKAHLDFWCDAVAAQLAEPEATPPEDGPAILRRQTLIWRQLLTRDKEPEAFLQRDERRRVHQEFKQLVWRSLLRPVPVAATLACVAVLAGLMAGIIPAASSSQAVVAFLGAIGLSQASLAVIARDRVRIWTELLWNRALAGVVFEATCLADNAFLWRRTSVSASLAGTGRRLARRSTAEFPARPTPQL